MPAQPLTFVVGSGRCGSTALSQVLRQHPQILSLSELFASLEPFPLREGTLTGEEFRRFIEEPRPFTLSVMRHGFWAKLPEDSEVRQALGNEMPVVEAIAATVLPHLTDDPASLLAELRPELDVRPSGSIADHYRGLFELLGRRLGTRVVVERSGYSLRLVPRLLELFPEARFVHLYRNGLDTALSMSRYPVFQAFRFLIERAAEAGRGGPDALSVEIDEMFRDGEVDVRPILDAQVPLAEYGRLWSETIIDGLAYLDDVPESRLISVAFEDLLDQPELELKRLAAHVGVDPLAEWLEAGRAELDSNRRGAARALAVEDLTALEESCAPGMRALGL
ncbi:sulfotransferase [Streptomyces sp. CB01881]|uniref:sulfotransferase family protein n=1 Tax=Streptomyces sp. CB01881 TaxID=2078691 RepID=UPI000CDBCB60|nr:sulfotransferase [Streptomyces sp. CB01881]AUY52519.1 hypothetical protein C2142_30425 [Streptomyces sp. CB01881]TYC70236.1 sulfotransferase [Streptomyces sp. CB01881]